ncbi:MAG TPA: hypothetical protein VFV68_17240 [Agriterribacter sp.]|nr:hypothetical protein [Agriterribacter sp.]
MHHCFIFLFSFGAYWYSLGKWIKSYQYCVALLMLISFTATQLPFELFHNHASNRVFCKENKSGEGICQHKSHLGTKKDDCWACSIHVEKVFVFTSPLPQQIHHTWFGFSQIPATEIQPNTPAVIALRGPPQRVA